MYVCCVFSVFERGEGGIKGIKEKSSKEFYSLKPVRWSPSVLWEGLRVTLRITRVPLCTARPWKATRDHDILSSLPSPLADDLHADPLGPNVPFHESFFSFKVSRCPLDTFPFEVVHCLLQAQPSTDLKRNFVSVIRHRYVTSEIYGWRTQLSGAGVSLTTS